MREGKVGMKMEAQNKQYVKPAVNVVFFDTDVMASSIKCWWEHYTRDESGPTCIYIEREGWVEDKTDW